MWALIQQLGDDGDVFLGFPGARSPTSILLEVEASEIILWGTGEAWRSYTRWKNSASKWAYHGEPFHQWAHFPDFSVVFCAISWVNTPCSNKPLFFQSSEDRGSKMLWHWEDGCTAMDQTLLYIWIRSTFSKWCATIAIIVHFLQRSTFVCFCSQM